MGINQTGKKSFYELFFQGRFLYLLISLLLLMAIAPIFEGMFFASILIDIFLTCTFLSGISAVSDRRFVPWLAAGLALPLLGSIWLSYFWELRMLDLARDVFGILFFTLLVVAGLDHIFRSKQVTQNLIHGAIVVYLMIGVLWAFLFSLVEDLQPGSFKGLEGVFGESRMLFIYYSFVTLSTLGYGDISPTTAQAGSLATLEALIGQIYMTVLVARLVGMHISSSMEK